VEPRLMLRPRKKPNLLNYLRIKDFAASAGVTERAVHAWLAKPKIDAEIMADVERQLGHNIPRPWHEDVEPFLKSLQIHQPKTHTKMNKIL